MLILLILETGGMCTLLNNTSYCHQP